MSLIPLSNSILQNENKEREKDDDEEDYDCCEKDNNHNQANAEEDQLIAELIQQFEKCTPSETPAKAPVDITGLDIQHAYLISPIKKWIKRVYLHETIPFHDYNRRDYFIKVADITLDKELNLSGKKEGQKKRNTVIQFVPVIDGEEYSKKAEWLYIFLMNGRIVKIGGTRVGLKGRVASYMCGHHVPERGKSGDCSKTNGFIYNTFDFYLQLGCQIEMYAYLLPRTEIQIQIFDKSTTVIAQTYHAYESTFLDDYKKQYNEYPVLCDNCDPDYKE